jgi:hypothetical protein
MRKAVIGVLLAGIVCVGIGYITWQSNADKKLVKDQEAVAARFGLAYAKGKCVDGSTSNPVGCDGLAASATTTDCSNGYVCWIVYVKANKPTSFSSLMFVERVDPQKDTSMAKLRVTDYKSD